MSQGQYDESGRSEMTPLTPIVDALAAALSDYWASTPEAETTLAGEVIAILATPEMRAIRALIRAVGEDTRPHQVIDARYDELPRAVDAWAFPERYPECDQ